MTQRVTPGQVYTRNTPKGGSTSVDQIVGATKIGGSPSLDEHFGAGRNPFNISVTEAFTRDKLKLGRK
jgi:hypothetical protein